MQIMGGMDDVLSNTDSAVVWAGEADIRALPFHADVRPAVDGELIRGLRVIHTPGHTKGHISLLRESDGLVMGGIGLPGVVCLIFTGVFEQGCQALRVVRHGFSESEQMRCVHCGN